MKYRVKAYQNKITKEVRYKVQVRILFWLNVDGYLFETYHSALVYMQDMEIAHAWRRK